jgi:tripartite-type tricarboxylate transporter receptor subunit TctC
LLSRIGALPTVPTVGEFVPGFEAVSWSFIVAPRDTPVAVIAVLNTAINTGLADPKVNQSIVDWGETALTISPADCGKLVVNESEKWGKVIREANIESEWRRSAVGYAAMWLPVGVIKRQRYVHRGDSFFANGHGGAF